MIFIRKLVITLLLSCSAGISQTFSGRVPISETCSSNGKFSLHSVSYDDEYGNLKGNSFVTANWDKTDKGSAKIVYEINRSFDLYDGEPYFAAISNDGRKIIYIKSKSAHKGEENKEVTYYVDGKLVKAYTANEFIDCQKEREMCSTFFKLRRDYLNDDDIVLKNYDKRLTEKDIFLIENVVFNRNDTIYLTDSRKKVAIYDLNSDHFIGRNKDFDSVYPSIKDSKLLKSKIVYYTYPYKNIVDLEDSVTKHKLSKAIEEISGLKFISIYERNPNVLHNIQLTGYISRTGKFEIETFETDSVFNRGDIESYLSNTIFNTDFIPKRVDKVFIKSFYGGYRNFNERIAQKETLRVKNLEKEEAKRRLTLSVIDGIYIPLNLYECMTELDKVLDFEAKNILLNSDDTYRFNSHGGGLGMWIRNNWGIHAGSRLSKYFHDRHIGKEMFGSDEISGVIIEQYLKWLKGDRSSWKLWEAKNTKK